MYKKILIVFLGIGLIFQFFCLPTGKALLKVEKAYAADEQMGDSEGSNVILPEVKNSEPEPSLPVIQDNDLNIKSLETDPLQNPPLSQSSVANQAPEQPKNSVNGQDTGDEESETVDSSAVVWDPVDIQINSGDMYTNNPAVDITISVKVNGKDPKKMKIANNKSDLGTAKWQKYKEKINWDLVLTPDGQKTVYFQFKKGSKISEIYSSEIILDTSNPYLFSAKTMSPNIIVLEFSEDIQSILDESLFTVKDYSIIDIIIDSNDSKIAYVYLQTVIHGGILPLPGDITPLITIDADAYEDLAGNKNNYESMIAKDGIAPQTPLNFHVISGAGYIEMSWAPVSDAIAYEIWRTSSPFAFYYEILAPTTNFRDYGVTNGVTYYYQVRARDAMGNLSPLLPQNLALSGMSYEIYAPTVQTYYYQPEYQPQIASAVVEKEAIKEQEPAVEEQGEVQGEETAEEEVLTNWPLIIGIILAGLVVLFWIYYWYVSWRESKTKTSVRRK